MAKVITPNDPTNYVKTFTNEQLRTLAASKNPAHIAIGFAAECELILREARGAV